VTKSRSSFPVNIAIRVYKQPIPNTLEDSQRNIFRTWEEEWTWVGQIKGMEEEYEKRGRKGGKNNKEILQKKTGLFSSSSLKSRALCVLVEIMMICEVYNKVCLRAYWHILHTHFLTNGRVVTEGNLCLF
jgi:hypothetical protein